MHWHPSKISDAHSWPLGVSRDMRVWSRSLSARLFDYDAAKLALTARPYVSTGATRFVVPDGTATAAEAQRRG